MNTKIIFFCTLIVFIFRTVAFADVWKAKNDWLEQDKKQFIWYDRYSEFIKKKIYHNEQLFIINNLPLDCADLAYASYLLFSAINQLPIEIHIKTSKLTIDQRTNQFDSYNFFQPYQDKNGQWIFSPRHLAFFRYILSNVDTDTLALDTFTISLDKKYLQEGVVYLRKKAGGSGHTKMIGKVDYTDPSEYPIKMMSTSVPQKIWDEFIYENFFDANNPSDLSFQFRKFYPVLLKKNIHVTDKAILNSLGFSLTDQQANKKWGEYSSFAINLAILLKPRLDPKILLELSIKQLNFKFQTRMDSIKDGYVNCYELNSDCSEDNAPIQWEKYSTVSRDKALMEEIKAMKKLQDDLVDKGYQNIESLVESNINQQYFIISWDIDFKNDEKNIDLVSMDSQNIKLLVLNEHLARFSLKLKLTELIEIWNNKTYSSDPALHFLERWGFKNIYTKSVQVSDLHAYQLIDD